MKLISREKIKKSSFVFDFLQVVTLSDDRIIDTNGAGDAFVGGFLAQLARGKSIKECVDCGIWAATEIIQQSGCTCPDKKYNA